MCEPEFKTQIWKCHVCLESGHMLGSPCELKFDCVEEPPDPAGCPFASNREPDWEETRNDFKEA